jgi:hypothetical protein
MDIYERICIYAFYAVSYLAIPFWTLMILFPKWPVTARVMGSVYLVLPFALSYAILVLFHLTDIKSFVPPNHEHVIDLLKHRYSDMLAWMHFVALDLFAGRWIYFDSRRQNFNVLVMAPILTLCFLLPPLGISLYLIYRLICGKSADPTANAGA